MPAAQALAGAPIPGKKSRFFSVPPPGVCNSLLVKAAEVCALIPLDACYLSAACICSAFQHRFTRRFALALCALFSSFAGRSIVWPRSTARLPDLPALFASPQDPNQAAQAAEVAEALLQEGTPLEAHTLKVGALSFTGRRAAGAQRVGQVCPPACRSPRGLRNFLSSGSCRGTNAGHFPPRIGRHASSHRHRGSSRGSRCTVAASARRSQTLATLRCITHGLQALIHSLARADELPAALPVLDAWLQQQEEALAEDANTHGPLQVGLCGADLVHGPMGLAVRLHAVPAELHSCAVLSPRLAGVAEPAPYPGRLLWWLARLLLLPLLRLLARTGQAYAPAHTCSQAAGVRVGAGRQPRCTHFCCMPALQVMSLLMDAATRAENTQMVLQVLARMARIGVTPSPQVSCLLGASSVQRRLCPFVAAMQHVCIGAPPGILNNQGDGASVCANGHMPCAVQTFVRSCLTIVLGSGHSR